MSTDNIDYLSLLQPHHLDALKEIGNIGVGHSATALSQLLNRKVEISIPRATISPIEDFSSNILSDPEDPKAIVLANTTGDLQIQLIGIFDSDCINQLLWLLRKQKIAVDLTKLTEIDNSFILEIGNILLLHYISAINKFLNFFMFPKAPSLSIDMGKAILDSILGMEQANYNSVLSIDVDLFTDNIQLKCSILMIPDQQTFNKLMSHIFSESWAQP